MSHTTRNAGSSDENRDNRGTYDNRDTSGGEWAGLIDARALWWRGPERCGHDREWEDCECRDEPGWDFGSTSGSAGLVGAITLAGHRYVTDRRLLVREDRLANWPGPHHPHHPVPAEMDGPHYIERAVALTTLLATPQAFEPTTCRFDPSLLGPLTDAGYDVWPLAGEPLAGEPKAHAVVAPDGLRVGLLMPILPGIDQAGQANAKAQPMPVSVPGSGSAGVGGRRS